MKILPSSVHNDKWVQKGLQFFLFLGFCTRCLHPTSTSLQQIENGGRDTNLSVTY